MAPNFPRTPKILISLLASAVCLGCRTEAKPDQLFHFHSDIKGSLSETISGTYENEGQSSNGERVTLASYFAAGIGRELRANERHEYFRSILSAPYVEIKLGNDNQWSVIAPGTTFARTWSNQPTESEVQYQNGILVIRQSLNGSAVNVVGRSHQLIEIQRQGSYLLVHEKMKSYGIMLLIPVWSSNEVWARFKAR